MRNLRVSVIRKTQSPEVLSVLQLCAINEPLFPNLKTVDLWLEKRFIPSIPLFLSPRTTDISIWDLRFNLPKAIVPSAIAALPTRCPNIQSISLYSLPSDPMVAAAVSSLLLVINRNALRCFRVDSPLTEEARQVICNLPNLRELSVIIERDNSLPTVVLPNLTNLEIKYDQDSDLLRVFHGATFGKLAVLTLQSESEQIDGFLEAFERVALAASIQNTLSEFCLRTSRSWTPNYSSLLPFTQLTTLVIHFSCNGGCSSTVDDNVVTNLARAMPKLETLELGDEPCEEILTGVTVNGLVVLAHRCPKLLALRVHFQVASLCAQPGVYGLTSGTCSTAPRRDCALISLEVGEIPVPEGLVLMVALTLAHIFPNIESVSCVDEDWEKVVDAIRASRELIDRSSEEHPLYALQSNFSDTSPGAKLDGVV